MVIAEARPAPTLPRPPLTFMPRYRLLAIDVDGTLVNSSDELTPATQAALRSANGRGCSRRACHRPPL